jgi:hypothetical protein
MRSLTIAAMCFAGLVSTIGFSGSTPSPVHAGRAVPVAHQAPQALTQAR